MSLPRNRGHAPKKKKLTQERESELTTECNIQFPGPVPSLEWPRSYAPIFTKVREIENIKYDWYRLGMDTCPHRVQRVRTLNRVHKLIRDASDCRKSSLHEEEWRRTTESNLLQHFSDQYLCGSCGNRIWAVEFKLGPTDSPCVDGHRPAVVPACSCNPNEIVQVEVSGESSWRPFLTRYSMPVLDDSWPDEIGVRKPDAIVGLRKTPEIEDILERLSSQPTYSPSSEKSMIFPFLVLEAKSEVGGAGFRAIETQTAFPIKTLLNIQQRLNQHRVSGIQPLVWFLAYCGDVWKVYACIQEDDLVKAIELWHGGVTRYDHALQLSLIVDLIYDWAIEVYQKEIFRVFLDPELLNPRETPITQGPPVAIRNTLIDLTLVNSSQDTRIADILPVSSPPNDGEMMLDHGLGVDALNQLSSRTGFEEEQEDWSRCAAIRNAGQAFFIFRHITLPETLSELIVILSSINPQGSIDDTAHTLLQLLSVEDPIVVNRAFVTQLESLWTEQVSELDSSSDDLILAHISFSSHFRPSDWQLIRSLSCITASVSSINILGQIAFSGYDFEIESSPLLVSRLAADIALPLRGLSGQESAAAAAQNLCLTLQKDNASAEYRWLEALENDQHMKVIWSGLYPHTPTIPLFHSMVYSSLPTNIEHIASPGVGDSISHAELSWRTRIDGALILKRPSVWPAQCPKYCLILFDASDVNNRPAMGRKVLQAISHGNFYQEDGRGIQDDDRVGLEQWAQFLLAHPNVT